MSELQELCGEEYLRGYREHIHVVRNYDAANGTGLAKINWKEKKYATMHAFFDSLGIDLQDFLAVSDHKNIDKRSVSRRLNPDNPPVINTVVMDWDGTIGNYYEKFGEALNVFLNHISYTRNIDRWQLEDDLKNQVKKNDEIGRLLFSKDGCKQILEQCYPTCRYPEINPSFLHAIDDYFIEGELVKAQEKMYSDTYFDAHLLINHLNKQNIPVIIHTDSPLAEFIQKLESTNLVKFATIKGELRVVKSSFTGLSINENINDKDAETAKYVKALEQAGVFVVLNSKEEAKPNPEAFGKIKQRMTQKGYLLNPDNILVVGDHLRKDGMFAKNIGAYFAWPGQLTVMTPLTVAMNRVSAGGWDKFKNRFVSQLHQLLNSELKDPKEREAFVKKMSVCHDYSQLYNPEERFFIMQAPRQISLENISTICTVQEIFSRQRSLA